MERNPLDATPQRRPSMRKPYPSHLTDAQWAIIEPLIPTKKTGRPRQVDIRGIL